MGAASEPARNISARSSGFIHAVQPLNLEACTQLVTNHRSGNDFFDAFLDSHHIAVIIELRIAVGIGF